MKLHLSFLSLIIFSINFSCSSTKNAAGSETIGKLKFLSEYVVPYNKDFKNTTIGGLSGIELSVVFQE